MEVRIENSFECLSQDEWDKYLGANIFEKMFLPEGALGESVNFLENINAPRLHELIQEHNNKVGSLQITYALCRHYFDKGIPDEPWYISPGKNGESVQYFPKFTKEHWMRKYWFNYFSDTFYLKISSVWDCVLEIIDEYYQYGIIKDLRFRSNIFKKLSGDNPKLLDLFNDIQQNPLYTEAQMYRTAAAHGISASEVSGKVQIKRDTVIETPKLVDGKVLNKKAKAKVVISLGVGNYTNVKTIMKNIEEYAKFSGFKICELIKLMEK